MVDQAGVAYDTTIGGRFTGNCVAEFGILTLSGQFDFYLEDGTPILRDMLWSIKITPTSIYGLSLEPVDERGYRFAWRADVGLVLEADNSAEYERLVAEAGHANWDIEINNIGTGALMNRLADRPGFDVGRCPTSLLTW